MPCKCRYTASNRSQARWGLPQVALVSGRSCKIYLHPDIALVAAKGSSRSDKNILPNAQAFPTHTAIICSVCQSASNK